MFWNMDAMTFICIPSPLKLFKTIKGECLNASSTTFCFFSDDTTSLASEKLCILKVSVGPLGKRPIFKYIPNSVHVNIHKCDT